MFIKNANLPHNRITTCLVGGTYKSVINDLNRLAIDVITVNQCSDLQAPVADHADMLFFHQGGDKIFAYHKCVEEIARLNELGFKVSLVMDSLEAHYPNDILLNCASVGEFCFCKEMCTYSKIIVSKNVVDVNQGYAKCSTLVCGEKCIITADCGIYDGAIKNGFDALLIKSGGIIINGYDSGFIGGCGALLDHSTMYFTGNIKSHTSGKEIVLFLQSRGIDIVCGTAKSLLDVGSIIGLTEKRP